MSVWSRVVKRGGRGDEDEEDREFFSAVWRVGMGGASTSGSISRED
jgi:hypothetical protein